MEINSSSQQRFPLQRCMFSSSSMPPELIGKGIQKPQLAHKAATQLCSGKDPWLLQQLSVGWSLFSGLCIHGQVKYM